MDITIFVNIIFVFEFFFSSGSRSSKTFKPKKNIPEGTHQYDLMKHAAATLGSGNLRLAVMLPEGEDLNEWVAVNSELKHLFSLYSVSFCIDRANKFYLISVFLQLLIFSIKSICFMAPSRNFAQRRVVPLCQLDQSTSIIGLMVIQ